MKKYYFTFGTNPVFPFKNGYVQVQAVNLEKAVELFNSKFPPAKENTINCAFVYAGEEFNTVMTSNCHMIIKEV